MRRDPRVCIVVTSTGSPLPRNKAVTWKGTCTLHDDRGDQGLVLRGAVARTARPGDEAAVASFVEFLDSPRRVILEVEPTQRIGYDGAKMGTATAATIAPPAPLTVVGVGGAGESSIAGCNLIASHRRTPHGR